ncbi:hypothetical protein [Aureimonas jatrophae]|nr:hypothetical protein [Aureimonas jatrophae]MBB3952626.1 hypothetical protein [Aureimonas jatrophae]
MLVAQAYADDYLDYAILASQTYLGPPERPNPENERALPERDRRPECETGTSDTVCADDHRLADYANERLDRWKLVYPEEGEEEIECRRSPISCAQGLRKVYAQIWVRKGRICEEAVIAFRGTQGGNPGDWFSNLRWFTRFYPTFDLYKQVQDATSRYFQIVRERSGCWRKGVTRIVAVGHSLGGGLAQQAAYRGGVEANGAAGPDGRFDRVVVFDTSFVTGALDVNRRDRARNSEGLRIEKVYEDGEILAYPQFVLRQLIPPSGCDPQIVTVRFNVARGLPTSQHSLEPLKTALLEWSLRQRSRFAAKDEAHPLPPPDACRRRSIG